MAADEDTIVITDNRESGAFELRDAGRLIGLARYAVVPPAGDEPERVVFFHTEVSTAYEGQGLAGRLATTAFEETIAAGRTIVPVCPYLKTFVRRHEAEYAAHLSTPRPTDLEAVDRTIDG